MFTMFHSGTQPAVKPTQLNNLGLPCRACHKLQHESNNYDHGILKAPADFITAHDHVSSILGDMGGKPKGEVSPFPPIM